MADLIIGSANFGMVYGFQDSRKQLDDKSVAEILDYSWEHGIHTIDTAMDYGNSELTIGKYLKNNPQKKFEVITKIFAAPDPYASLCESLEKLNRSEVYGVLVHDFPTFIKDQSLLDHLIRFKEEKKCRHIGFSIYYPEQIEYLIKENIEFSTVQLAYSMFDQRFNDLFPALKERNVEIHVRSVFLQGLFFADTKQLGSHFDSVKSRIDGIQKISRDSGISLSSICLNFANNEKYIDKIVVGADSLKNLKDTIDVHREKDKVAPYVEELKKNSETNVDILFPHFWKL